MATSHPVPIRILVDTAERALAVPWLDNGVAHGVTTNPTLLRRAGLGLGDLAELGRWAGEGGREVCVQLWGENVEQQYGAAMRLRELVPTATVKVPVSPIGSAVVQRLHAQGVPVLLTAVYSAKQAVIASALKVRYLAPYFERMQRAGRDAVAEVAEMTAALPQDGSAPLVMAASVKTADDVLRLVGHGVRVFTLPPQVIQELFADPLTSAAIRVFEDDMSAVLAH